MSAEGWTALATIVIAVATVVYMAVSIFQGRMLLKSFRLDLMRTLINLVTSEETDLAKILRNEVFLRGYQEAFRRDYKLVNKALFSVKINASEVLRERMKEAAELHQVFQEERKRFLSNLPDPFLGVCANEPELIDEITESIMQAREEPPLRQTGG